MEITIFKRTDPAVDHVAYCTAVVTQDSGTHITFETEKFLQHALGTSYCVKRKFREGKQALIEIEFPKSYARKGPYTYTAKLGIKYRDIEPEPEEPKESEEKKEEDGEGEGKVSPS